jgi:hypothetical protein
MKANSSMTKLFGNIIKITCFAVGIASLSTTSAMAQVNFQSTATFSGTIQLPKNNPNFNQNITQVPTDNTGAYYRTVNGKNVFVYRSKYFKSSGSGSKETYYANFKGIPVTSYSGTLSSPAFAGGCVKLHEYQGQQPSITVQGIVQDEFTIIAYYVGTVKDPKTGLHTGVFELNGYGPRYSDQDGGESPTVFDFKSDIPGAPTVQSLTVHNVPINNLSITTAPSNISRSCTSL